MVGRVWCEVGSSDDEDEEDGAEDVAEDVAPEYMVEVPALIAAMGEKALYADGYGFMGMAMTIGMGEDGVPGAGAKLPPYWAAAAAAAACAAVCGPVKPCCPPNDVWPSTADMAACARFAAF